MIDPLLKEYIENYIFPQYEKNDRGHRLDHIMYVIRRCLELSKDKDIHLDMLYTIASYHDIGHYIDAKRHEIISAQILYEDEKLRDFFREEQIIIMKEAIEDHRASLGKEPRSIYGKLVSSADRMIDVDESLRRIYFYDLAHFQNLSEEETLENCYQHTLKKFGINGYAPIFLEDEKYEKYLKELQYLIKHKKAFIERMKWIISHIK